MVHLDAPMESDCTSVNLSQRGPGSARANSLQSHFFASISFHLVMTQLWTQEHMPPSLIHRLHVACDFRVVLNTSTSERYMLFLEITFFYLKIVCLVPDKI